MVSLAVTNLFLHSFQLVLVPKLAEENVLKTLLCVNANLVVSAQLAVHLVLVAQEALFVPLMELVTMVPVGVENALVKMDGVELAVAQVRQRNEN